MEKSTTNFGGLDSYGEFSVKKKTEFHVVVSNWLIYNSMLKCEIIWKKNSNSTSNEINNFLQSLETIW